MKKSVLAVSAATLFGFSAASIAATPSFFVGAQAGYQNIDLEYSDRDSFGTASESFSSDYSLSGLAGGIFAGVKFNVTPNFYLAPEVNLGISNADGGESDSYNDSWNGGSVNYSESYDYEVEADRSYGIGVLAGYKFTEATSFYGRLGYQRTKFEASYNESWSLIDQGFSDSDSFSASDSKTFGGVRFGVGMETAVSSNVALRLDWSQTHYSSETFSDDQGFSFTFDPTESLFQAGVVVSF